MSTETLLMLKYSHSDMTAPLASVRSARDLSACGRHAKLPLRDLLAAEVGGLLTGPGYVRVVVLCY